MKLPNAGRVIIDERKLREYLLSKVHPIGRFKAAFFATLGFDAGRWEELATQLRAIAMEGEATLAEQSVYGDKYLISAILSGPQGRSAAVVTVWIVPTGGDIPRLVTVYPE